MCGWGYQSGSWSSLSLLSSSSSQNLRFCLRLPFGVKKINGDLERDERVDDVWQMSSKRAACSALLICVLTSRVMVTR
ncbi:hypothetical protein K492DRAFT_70706 [Lichtheimia hyalospora FSU 10163]|nr:hypothetical protein K492DRAFT_70706 [Lichtheimia hyalospora FSU 10163]